MAQAGEDQRASPVAPDATGHDTVPADQGTLAGSAAPGHRDGIVKKLSFQFAVLAGYLAAGVAASWPRPSYLAGRLPATVDQGSYVWDFWWIAHQVTHLGNPWFTRQMAAPAGVRLGFDTLMPLPGLIMTPVTLAFGPSASYNLLTILLPGLACYTAYRVARLWLSSRLAAIVSGAFYGLSTMLVWQDWYHINIAAGAVLLPLALEAAVRLQRGVARGGQPPPRARRAAPPHTTAAGGQPSPCTLRAATPRRPGRLQAAVLGLVLGCSLLVNQESAILAAILALLALLPWLVRGGTMVALRRVCLAAAVAVVVASPQIAAMAQQALSGGTTMSPRFLARYDANFGVAATSLFAPSPRTADFGLTGIASLFQYQGVREGAPTFGVVLSALAVLGLVVSWRRRNARLLALLWAASAVLALGTSLKIAGRIFMPLPMSWHHARMSALMPYTWLIHLPGLSGFREADRLALLGLLPAALLAGKGAEWLARRVPALLAATLALGVLEAGFSGAPYITSMPTTRPRLDAAIAADHSRSIVVDVPYGLRGGVADIGKGLAQETLVLATADGHPRAVSYTSWVPADTAAAIRRHPFYRWLMAAEARSYITPAQVQAARQDAIRMHVVWAVVWRRANTGGAAGYLTRVGFAYRYRVNKVEVFQLLPTR